MRIHFGQFIGTLRSLQEGSMSSSSRTNFRSNWNSTRIGNPYFAPKKCVYMYCAALFLCVETMEHRKEQLLAATNTATSRCTCHVRKLFPVECGFEWGTRNASQRICWDPWNEHSFVCTCRTKVIWGGIAVPSESINKVETRIWNSFVCPEHQIV